jgi:hypothetical protein
MQTPVSTYTHTAGLIEPWGCIHASDELSSGALAAIAGVRPATLRQRLSRASLPASPSRAAVRFLIRQGAPARRDAPAVEIDEPKLPAGTAPESVNPEHLSEALFRSLCEGDIQLLVNSLHLSTRAAQRLFKKLGDAIAGNVFGLHLDLDLPVDPAAQMGVPRSRAKRAPPLSFARVDQEWTRRCLKVRSEKPNLAAMWSTVMHGLDPRSGQIATRGDQEFISLLNYLPVALNLVDKSRYRIGVVLDRSARKSDYASIRRIIDGTASKGCPIHEGNYIAPRGWAISAAVVESVSTGRRQIAALALLAIASELLPR